MGVCIIIPRASFSGRARAFRGINGWKGRAGACSAALRVCGAGGCVFKGQVIWDSECKETSVREKLFCPFTVAIILVIHGYFTR